MWCTDLAQTTTTTTSTSSQLSMHSYQYTYGLLTASTNWSKLMLIAVQSSSLLSHRVLSTKYQSNAQQVICSNQTTPDVVWFQTVWLRFGSTQLNWSDLSTSSNNLQHNTITIFQWIFHNRYGTLYYLLLHAVLWSFFCLSFCSIVFLNYQVDSRKEN